MGSLCSLFFHGRNSGFTCREGSSTTHEPPLKSLFELVQKVTPSKPTQDLESMSHFLPGSHLENVLVDGCVKEPRITLLVL